MQQLTRLFAVNNMKKLIFLTNLLMLNACYSSETIQIGDCVMYNNEVYEVLKTNTNESYIKQDILMFRFTETVPTKTLTKVECGG